MRMRTSDTRQRSADLNQEAAMTEATRRIQDIIDDANRQAGQIIVNAEVEARKYAASVKEQTDREAAEYAKAMAALSDSLITQAEALSRESQRLLAEIGEREVFEAESTTETAIFEPEWERVPVHEEIGPVEPRLRSEQTQEPDSSPQYSAGARLLATQMAVAGSTRSDIHDRLVNDFGIGDPNPLLDSILGPG